jgi:uncharacterized protein DUF3352
MPASVKLRLVLPALLAALAALFVVGCGGGDDSGDGDLAGIVPPKSPLYIEFTVRPEGETKANIETLARDVFGVDDVGGLIAAEFEESAEEDGEEIDFEKEVEPLLGEEGAIFFEEYAEDDFEGTVVAVQVADADAAAEFVDEHSQSEDGPAEDGSYEGVDYKVEKDDDQTIGVFDDLLVLADDEELFKRTVDASKGESLGDEETFTSAVSEAPAGSVADLFVDIGGLIEASGDEIDPDTRLFLDSTGLEPEEATAVASLVPGSNQIEIDLSTDLSGDNPPSGDASELLGSLPATSVGAFASAEFGKRFNEAIDKIDEQGIPDEGVPPNKLKKTLKDAGIDLEAIVGSVGDAGAYVTGNSESSLGGALVLTTEDADQAKNTVSNIGLFLRSTGASGITRITEGASGFSIRSPEFGRQPVVVAARDSRIAIGYGLAPTLASLEDSAQTLADLPAYKEATSALGGAPITAFVDGPAALKLASSLVPPGEAGFEEAKRYLQRIDYLALGSEASGDLAVVKLIVGLAK